MPMPASDSLLKRSLPRLADDYAEPVSGAKTGRRGADHQPYGTGAPDCLAYAGTRSFFGGDRGSDPDWILWACHGGTELHAS